MTTTFVDVENPSAQEGIMDEPKKKPTLSLDWWTVIVGLALAAVVLAGLPAIPW